MSASKPAATRAGFDAAGLELCAHVRSWNNQACSSPADVVYNGVPMCAECANRSGVLYDFRPDPH
jgi:hypothetical protein